MSLYNQLEIEYITSTSSFLSNGVSNIINNLLAPAFASMFILYLMFYGYNLIMGQSKEPVLDGLGRILKFVFIGTFALNSVYFADWVINMVNGLPITVSNAILYSGSPPPAVSTLAYLDQIMDKGIKFSAILFEKAGKFDWDLIFAAFLILMAIGFLTGYAAYIILVAKFIMILLLSMGPLFIMALVTKKTEKFFEQWLGQLLNYMILLLLITLALHLILNFFERYLDAAIALDPKKSTQHVNLVTMILYTFVLFAILKQLNEVAASIGGGVAVHSKDGINDLRKAAGMAGAVGSFIKNRFKKLGNKNKSGNNSIKSQDPKRSEQAAFKQFQSSGGSGGSNRSSGSNSSSGSGSSGDSSDKDKK